MSKVTDEMSAELSTSIIHATEDWARRHGLQLGDIGKEVIEAILDVVTTHPYYNTFVEDAIQNLAASSETLNDIIDKRT